MAKKQAASPTQTPEASSPAPNPPVAEGVTDAEVVTDVPPRQKVVSAKPLDASRVFDADVNDASNARPGAKPEPGAPPAEAPPRQRRARKSGSSEELPPEPTDAQVVKARNYVKMAEGLHRAGLRVRYSEILSAESLADLDARLALNTEQLDLMAIPLAEGLARHGAVLPWYVELGIGALGMGMARANVCKKIEDEYQRQQKAKEAAKP